MSDSQVLKALASSPWERMQRDWFEVRREQVGGVAMALEFGAPLLPPRPSDITALLCAPRAAPAEVTRPMRARRAR
jgi:hypothetical protein